MHLIETRDVLLLGEPPRVFKMHGETPSIVSRLRCIQCGSTFFATGRIVDGIDSVGSEESSGGPPAGRRCASPRCPASCIVSRLRRTDRDTRPARAKGHLS
jgi:hypothetical protein